MQLKKCVVVITCAVATAAAVSFAMPAYAQKRPSANAAPDDVFLALRDASRSDDSVTSVSLAARLPDYVIPSYVDYYRLKPRVRDFTAPVSEIRDFLARYDGSAIADRLRNDWLLALGKTGDWTTFDEQYPLFVLNDDVQVKCFALNSRALKGQNVADEARALLTSPKDYGQGCSDLIGTLAQNHQFSESDLWAQIRQAVEAGNTTVARRAAIFTDNGDVSLQQVIDKPALMLARGPGQGRTSHELYIIAIGRAAKGNPQQGNVSQQRIGTDRAGTGHRLGADRFAGLHEADARSHRLLAQDQGCAAVLRSVPMEDADCTARRRLEDGQVHHRRHARFITQRYYVDLLVGTCAEGRRPDRGFPASVSVDRFQCQLLRPTCHGRPRAEDHHSAGTGTADTR